MDTNGFNHINVFWARYVRFFRLPRTSQSSPFCIPASWPCCSKNDKSPAETTMNLKLGSLTEVQCKMKYQWASGSKYQGRIVWNGRGMEMTLNMQITIFQGQQQREHATNERIHFKVGLYCIANERIHFEVALYCIARLLWRMMKEGAILSTASIIYRPQSFVCVHEILLWYRIFDN